MNTDIQHMWYDYRAWYTYKSYVTMYFGEKKRTLCLQSFTLTLTAILTLLTTPLRNNLSARSIIIMVRSIVMRLAYTGVTPALMINPHHHAGGRCSCLVFDVLLHCTAALYCCTVYSVSLNRLWLSHTTSWTAARKYPGSGLHIAVYPYIHMLHTHT